MGTDNLPDLAASPTKVDATTTQYNAVTNALQGHQVMRETDGTAVDDTYDIGRPSSGRPRKVYVGTGINVDGSDIDFSAISLVPTGVSSGKSKDSGYPDYLTAEGVTGGATNAFTIEATTTNLVMTIDGDSYTLETDLVSGDLTLAPSSNNTAAINDTNMSNQDFTKTLGEYGGYVPTINTIGSEITSVDGEVHAYKIVNGGTTEVFLGRYISNGFYAGFTRDVIEPIKRGIGGTKRGSINNADTITLLKAHYIFLDNDLATIDTTTTYPTWSATAPSAPATGDYWYDSDNETWKRYSGASWEQLGRIYLGIAICDSADCLYVEPVGYNLSWDNLLSYEKLVSNRVSGADEVLFKGEFNCNVAGTKIAGRDIAIDTTSNTDSDYAPITSQYNYIYLQNDGTIYTSSAAPRLKDDRKGFYHPSQYWRCIGFYYRNGSSSSYVEYVPNTGRFQSTTAPGTHIDALIGGGTPGNLQSPTIPRMAMEIRIYGIFVLTGTPPQQISVGMGDTWNPSENRFKHIISRVSTTDLDTCAIVDVSVFNGTFQSFTDNSSTWADYSTKTMSILGGKVFL